MNKQYTKRYANRKAHKIIEKLIGHKLCRNDNVHHINGNIYDNRPANLLLMSRSEHTSLHMQNNKIGAKLSIEDVRDIRKMLKDKIYQWLIGYAFGVHKTTINAIKRGRSWSSI